jgi:hypothetical protein
MLSLPSTLFHPCTIWLNSPIWLKILPNLCEAYLLQFLNLVFDQNLMMTLGVFEEKSEGFLANFLRHFVW